MFTGALWQDLVLFAGGAAAVWWAGRNLAERTDVIAERTGLGQVFAGALLLGFATSLPEIATTVSAAAVGAAALAGNNLLGGVAMQVAVLAVVDMTALRGSALTLFSPHSTLLLHGIFMVLLLAVAIAGVVGPDVALLGRVSPWSFGLLAIYLLTLYQLERYENNPRWQPRGEVAQPPESAVDMKDAQTRRYADVSLRRVQLQFAMFALVVFAGGYAVAISGESIAERTGLGQTLVGATLVAIATSLPEVSTTYAAVRFGAYSMAVSNILGTNALEVALLLPADLAYAEGSIFDALDEASVLLAALGAGVTLVYLWGVLERRDRVICGLGVDSACVLCMYIAGILLFAQVS